MAHEEIDREMQDVDRKEHEVVGPQESEPVKVMRNVREPSWKERGAPRSHGTRDVR